MLPEGPARPHAHPGLRRRASVLPLRSSIHSPREVFLPRFDGAFINGHEHLIVSVGGVLGHELSAAGLSDLFHISRMGPNPFHLAGQVLGITRDKVYPRAFVCYHLFEGSESRYDGWGAAGVSLRDRHGEILVALARHDQESSTLHCRKNRLAVEVTEKPHPSKPQPLDQSFELTAQGAIPHDPQSNLAPELLPSGEQGSQSFFRRETTHEQGVVGNVALGAWIRMNKIGFDDNFCRGQSASDELISGKIRQRDIQGDSCEASAPRESPPTDKRNKPTGRSKERCCGSAPRPAGGSRQSAGPRQGFCSTTRSSRARPPFQRS